MSNGSCLGRHDCWISWEEEDAILNFSDELIEELGWQEDDLLEWIDNEDGTFSLVKAQ